MEFDSPYLHVGLKGLMELEGRGRVGGMRIIKNSILVVAIVLLAALVIAVCGLQKNETVIVNHSRDNVQKTFDPKINRSELALLYAQNISNLPEHYAYCLPEKKSFCSIEGCEEVRPTVFNLIGITEGQGSYFARCDNNPCDIYPAKSNTSGIYQEFITKEPHGMLFKLSTQDNSFTEIVTLGTDSYVSVGHCYFTKT